MESVVSAKHGPRFKDLTGRRFERLTVIDFAESRNSRSVWLCQCECGNQRKAYSSNLLRGFTKSCGCLNKELTIARNCKGARNVTAHPLYKIWDSMRQRTTNKNNRVWKYYGGRGVQMCEVWWNDFLLLLMIWACDQVRCIQ